MLILGHLTCYKQDRDTYDSILKTLDPMLSYRTIKSEFQLGTEGTYLNLVLKLGHLTYLKQDRDTYDSILKTIDPILSHRTI